MSDGRLFAGTSIPALKKIMDLGAARQRARAGNLANAAVEGYERRDARFADEMNRAGRKRVKMAHTHPGHMGSPKTAGVEIAVKVEPGLDGTTKVDMEEELVSLAANQLKFNLAARLANLRIMGLRASIQGRS